MDSLRKSFKSRNPSTDQEDQPILSEHHHHDSNSSDHREFVINVDGNSNNLLDPNNKIWRESSYDFWNQDGLGSEFCFENQNQQQPSPSLTEINEDQPTRPVKKSGSMSIEMEELKKPNATISSTSTSKELRVSFQESASSDNGSSHDKEGCQARVSTGGGRDGGAEVLRCTSNSSFRPTSGLLRSKTKSRLLDPPPLHSGDDGKKSGRVPAKSGQLKSGFIGKDEDDEDPFLDEDLPDDFKRSNFNFFTILQWVSLLLILAALACSLWIPVLQRQTLWNLHLWKWELLVLVLICGRLVSGWGIRIVVFFIERNFLLRKRVLYFVYGVRKAVQNCLWLGLVLIAWHYIFDKKVERETNSNTLPYVTKVLFCLLFATLMRLVKTLLVKVLASSFHVSTYFDRIQESLFNQYVIETLSGPPLIEIQNTKEEEDRVFAEVQKLQNAGATMPADLKATMLPSKSGNGGSGRGTTQKSSQVGKSGKFSGVVSRKEVSMQQEGITIDHLHKLNQKNVSAWNMKRLIHIVRYGALSTLDEQIPHAGGEDESVQIQSEYEAKVAAKKIFHNVAKPGAKYIYLVDLMRFMREDEALKTMSLFEGAQENKRVSRKSLKSWVVNAFRERRALSLTLNDTKTAVNKLHQMANVVVGIIVFAIWLLILDIATTHFFVFISSQVLLVTFVFGNTFKMIFEAIIFLFVMHPFDVGDRCEVEGVQMIVEEMNILTTIFLRYDNQKIVFPNSVLSTKPISNIYRSPDMGDSIDFCVHVSTSVEKLAIMKERIKGFIEGRKEHWQPNPSVVLRDVEDMNRLKISVWLCHRINFQDMGERWARRELVVQEMIRVLRELDIEYRMLPLDVNVRDLPALSSNRLPSTWTTCS